MESEGIRLGDPLLSALERDTAAICLTAGSGSFVPLKATSAGGAAASRQLAAVGEDLLPSGRCAHSQKATQQAGRHGTSSRFLFLPVSVRCAQLEALLVAPNPYASWPGLHVPRATAGKQTGLRLCHTPCQP